MPEEQRPHVELTMLPGIDGDALLLEYGDGSPGNRPARILVDGGRAASYPLIAERLRAGGPLDVVVVTHVDQDHVLGILALLADPERPEIRDVWFNGYDHLATDGGEHFGARDGELLTTALDTQSVPWNAAFAGRSVLVGRAAEPRGDGARFTVLSPDRDQLRRLAPLWRSECERHGLIPGKDPVPPPVPEGFESFGGPPDLGALAASKFRRDTSVTNASSIGFLFEYRGVRIVFTGDGDDARLCDSLQPLAEAAGGRLRVDALKVSHHGSAGNLSTRLLGLLDCPRYLFSTSGDRHGHPDAACLARIMVHGGPGKELVFNYAGRAAAWDVPAWRNAYGYTVRGPAGTEGFAAVGWTASGAPPASAAPAAGTGAVPPSESEPEVPA